MKKSRLHSSPQKELSSGIFFRPKAKERQSLTIVGIDPGLKGGLAAIFPDGSYALYAMPLKNGSVCSKKLYDFMISVRPRVVFLESLLVLPHNSRVSISVMGFNWGRIAGVLEALEIKTKLVAPTEWQRGLLVPKGPRGTAKDRIKARASVMFGGQSFIPKGKKVFQDGLVDALMIATYGKMNL